MKYLQITFYIVAMFLSSCVNKAVNSNKYNPNMADLREMIRMENNNTFIINPDDAIETDLSEGKNLFIAQQKVVPLDSKKGKIGNITKIITHKDRIYIVDEAKNNECIFVYDTLGHSINKIDKRGKGPGEYVAIQSVMIDTVENRIILADQLINQVLFYDLDGNFKDQKKLPFNNLVMDKLGNKYIYFVHYGQNLKNSFFDNYSIFTGTIDKVNYYGFARQSCEKNMWFTAILGKNYKNDLLYKPNFSDTIYQITSDSTFVLHSIFNFKNSMFKKCSQFNALSLREVDEYYKNYDGVFSLGFFDSKNFIFFKCSNRLKNYIYCKQQNECYEIKFNGFYGDVNKVKYIFEMPCASIGENVISIAQPYELIDKYQAFEPHMKNPSEVPITKLVKSISISDNPLLVFSKFSVN